MLAGTLAAPSAGAQPPPVEDDPAALIEQGRHLDAADAFERLYEASGDAALLFGKATALRRGGDCRGAIETLERFVATNPPEADTAAARDVIEVCEQILADDAPPEPPPPILVEPTPVPETPPPAPSEPWTRDVAGGVLLGSGVAVVVGGSVLVGLAAARTRPREESEAGFERRERSVRTMSAVGGAMAAAGVALIIGSIVRYAVIARRR